MLSPQLTGVPPLARATPGVYLWHRRGSVSTLETIPFSLLHGQPLYILLKFFTGGRKDTQGEPAIDRKLLVELAAEADLLRERGEHDAARLLYERMLIADSKNLYAMLWLSVVHKALGDLTRARDYCERGLAIDPAQIGLLMQLGAVGLALADPLLALECYERVYALDPDVPDLDALLADQYCKLGRIAEGVAAFDRSLKRNPGFATLESSRLFVLNYAEVMAPEHLSEEHVRWGRRHEAALAHVRYPRQARARGDRLRIAYVSPDLRDHAVAFFVSPLLREHDRARFDICCFHTVTQSEDPVSARMRQHATEWVHLPGATDIDVAQAIYAAKIDIAVDMAGHTSSSRLLAFARQARSDPGDLARLSQHHGPRFRRLPDHRRLSRSGWNDRSTARGDAVATAQPCLLRSGRGHTGG